MCASPHLRNNSDVSSDSANECFLSAAVLSGLLQSETVTSLRNHKIFIEMMKTLVMATAAKQATIEFALSLMLLLGLALYVQSFNGWGLNLIVCVYIQFLDTISGFIGTFLLARRDFGH